MGVKNTVQRNEDEFMQIRKAKAQAKQQQQEIAQAQQASEIAKNMPEGTI